MLIRSERLILRTVPAGTCSGLAADLDLLQLELAQNWERAPASGPSNDIAYSYRWVANASVTLDLIGLTDRQATARTKTLMRFSHGGGIGAVRVLAPWIVECYLIERCFTPGFAQVGLLRLTRLGLVASRLQAVSSAIDEMITAERERRPQALWSQRIDKDLQDLALLLNDRHCIAPLWERRYRMNAREIGNHWQRLREGIRSLRHRPVRMAASTYQTLQDRIVPMVPMGWP